MPATPAGVPLLRDAARAWATASGIGPGRAEDVGLAVTEAATNAVLHAFVGREPGTITLSGGLEDGRFVLRVVDDGRGPALRDDSPGLGLGLSIMRQVAEELRLGAGPGGAGTEVRLAFAVPDAAGAAVPVAAPVWSADLDDAETAALLRTFTDFVFKNDPDGALLTDMPQWRRVTGQTPDELLGSGWLAGVHPDDRERVGAAWRRAVAAREVYDVEYRITGPGGDGWVHARSAPVAGADGTVVRWVGTVTDVTARHRAEDIRRELTTALARDQELLRQVVELSPVAIAVLWGPDHTFRLFNDRYLELVPPGRVAVGVPVAEALPEAAQVVPVLDGVLEGRPHAFDDLAVPFEGPGSHHGHRYYQGVYSPVSPHGGAPQGVLVVAAEVTEQVRRRDDLAQQVVHERQAAERLQRALLPEAPPSIAGLDLALAYLPAGQEVGVGGDWYDVLDLGDGSVLLVIGDVAGRGMQAATWMSQMRAAVRAYAVEDAAPGAVLGRCAALGDRLGLPDMISAACGRLWLATGAVTWASAGHPAPLHLRPGRGTVTLLQRSGPPLGAGPATYPEAELTLGPGEAFVLYTDGAVEDRRRSLADGIADLLAAAPDPRGGAAAVRDALAAHVTARGRGDDDVALLVVRRDR